MKNCTIAQGKEVTWTDQGGLFGHNQLRLDAVAHKQSGNYTCVVENAQLVDSISYTLAVQGEA